MYYCNIFRGVFARANPYCGKFLAHILMWVVLVGAIFTPYAVGYSYASAYCAALPNKQIMVGMWCGINIDYWLIGCVIMFYSGYAMVLCFYLPIAVEFSLGYFASAWEYSKEIIDCQLSQTQLYA